MKNYRKILYPLTALLLAIVLAACAGTRNLEGFSIVGEAPQFEDGILTLAVDETHSLAGRAHFDNQTTDSVLGALVDWTSSNPDAVTVDENGNVTAVAEIGGATITGEYRGFSDEITVVVNPFE